MTQLSLAEVHDLAFRMLRRAGASQRQADATARSIRDAEADGIRAVGLAYLPYYCDHLACGKVDGEAVPSVSVPRQAMVQVDAANGFAHVAYEAALDSLVNATTMCGIASMAIRRSYSAGVLGWFVEPLAERGLVALLFANSSPMVAPHGGKTAFFGTNPLAYAVPRAAGLSPLVADLSTSAVAYVRVKAAADAGESIPLGWAVDAEGNPTTDAHAALAGTVAPLGGYKGTALALLVDVLAGGVPDAGFSFESSSFVDNDGGPVGVGQLIIAIDPTATAPRFVERIEAELAAMTGQDGVRLPGDARLLSRQRTAVEGVSVPDDLMHLLTDYANFGPPQSGAQ